MTSVQSCSSSLHGAKSHSRFSETYVNTTNRNKREACLKEFPTFNRNS